MKTDPDISELLSISPNKIGLIDPPNTEFESQLHLLYIMLNTLEGEMIYNYNFGVNWTSVLPKGYNDENIKNFEYETTQLLNDKAKIYLPNFYVLKTEAQSIYDDLYDNFNLVVLTQWIYKQKFQINAVTIIKWNNKFGTLLDQPIVWSTQNNKSSTPMSSQILSNMIYSLNKYIKEL